LLASQRGSALRRRPQTCRPAVPRALARIREDDRSVFGGALFELEVAALDIPEVAQSKQKLAAQVGPDRIGYPARLEITQAGARVSPAARAASGHAAAAPMNVMNSRRFS
jgi:hypothetical protein